MMSKHQDEHITQDKTTQLGMLLWENNHAKVKVHKTNAVGTKRGTREKGLESLLVVCLECDLFFFFLNDC